MTELQPGTPVTATIRLQRRLGAGGMGSVWVAEHLSLRTQVVVKFMAIELAASPEAVERFSREAASAAQVKSPHVVQMLDHGVTPAGVPFIVMELLEGHDLGKHLAARGRLSIGETAQIVGQVCKALARAHERGIVHRDIKPDNIFLCANPDGEIFVKLLDFGIAKADSRLGVSSGTKTGAMIGTPYYMSPEQIVGSKSIDSRTDLWSLGIVAYECVVGLRPFDEEVFGALAIHIHSGPISVPSGIDPTLPPAFDWWFARACARDVSARFATAKELGDTLAEVARARVASSAVARLPVGVTLESADHVSRSALTMTSTGSAGSHGAMTGGQGAALGFAPGTPAVSAAPSTNGGVGLGTATRPSGGNTAAWIVAGVIAVTAIGVGGALVAKRMASPPSLPSSAPVAPLPVPSAPIGAPSASAVPSLPAVAPSASAPSVSATPPPPSAVAPPQPPRTPPATRPAATPRPAAAPKPAQGQETDVF
jgi:serine/threonine-protein kinase